MRAPFPEVPAHRAFHHAWSVRAEDIDELGHANNVVWVRWVNEAAIAHSRSIGLSREVYFALGVVWVVRRHDIEYLLPALDGQELEAFTWVETLRGATSLRRTIIRRDGRDLARAATTWVLIDAATSKPRRIPPEMMERYGFST